MGGKIFLIVCPTEESLEKCNDIISGEKSLNSLTRYETTRFKASVDMIKKNKAAIKVASFLNELDIGEEASSLVAQCGGGSGFTIVTPDSLRSFAEKLAKLTNSGLVEIGSYEVEGGDVIVKILEQEYLITVSNAITNTYVCQTYSWMMDGVPCKN